MGHYLSDVARAAELHYDVVVSGLATHRVVVEEYCGTFTVRAPGLCHESRRPEEAVKVLAKWHRWDVLFFDRVRSP